MIKANIERKITNLVGTQSYSLIINTYLIMALRLFSTASGFIFWAIAAQTMSAQQVGLLSSAIAASTLLAGLSQLGLNYGLVKYLGHVNHPHRLLNGVVGMVTVVSLLLSVLFLLTLPISSPALLSLQRDLGTLLLFVALVMGTSLLLVFHWSFLARRRPVFSLITNAIQSTLAIILLLLFTLNQSDYLNALSGYTLSMLIGLAVLYLLFLPQTEEGYRFRVVFPSTFRSPFSNYCLSNYLIDQLQKLPDNLLTLLVVNVLGPTVGAYFFVVWAITTGLASIVGSFALSLFTEGANKPKLVAIYARKMVIVGSLFTAVIAILAALAGPYILAIYGADYANNGALLLALFTFSLIPNLLVFIYISVLRVRNEMKQLTLITALDMALGLLAVYWFMTSFGLIGSGMGWLVSRFAILIYVIYVWRRDKPTEQSLASSL